MIRNARNARWCTQSGTLTALLLVLAAPMQAQRPSFTPLRARMSDSAVAGDIQRFAVLEEGYRRRGALRQASYVGLARDAYERNDEGAVTALMLGAADGSSSVPHTKRSDLWALLDSAQRSTAAVSSDSTLVADLEVALVRAQYPILGAPTCDAWEREADRLAGEVRRQRAVAPPVVVVNVVTPPPPFVPAAPAPVVVPSAAPAQLHGIPSMVHFALDKSYLSPASQAVLDVLVDSLRRFPDVSIVLEGHTDLRASVAYNLALSRRRTMSVRAYLLGKGVRDARITIVAQGKSHLQSDGVGVTDHARNRRVQLRYFAPDGREIEAMQLLDDLQLESSTARVPVRPRRK